MIEVTADTNIYVSAFNFAGAPRQFLVEAIAGNVHLAISRPIWSEVQGVLRGKFCWSDEATDHAWGLVAACAKLVYPEQTLDVVHDDPDDNRVIECAVEAGSRYIVTGDGDLLRLASYGAIRIVRVADFLKLIDKPTS